MTAQLIEKTDWFLAIQKEFGKGIIKTGSQIKPVEYRSDRKSVV